jgi:LmbE family N-acetylglucosaminyl deacetylase
MTNQPVVLVMMAHPDDAEILCAGTLIRLSHLGWSVHIATAANGDCGSVELGRKEIAAVRRVEAENAAAMIGGSYHCLGISDVEVAYTPDNISAAIDLFRSINPSVVITHPRHDYMLDHEQTHLLVRAASFAFAVPNASTLPIPEHTSIPYLYYADPLEGRDPYSGQLVEPSTLIDISDVMDAKSEMLSCHVSQRQWLQKHHGMDEYIMAMQRHGQMRGQASGCDFAEAFVQHRGHAYPQDDILNQQLGSIN